MLKTQPNEKRSTFTQITHTLEFNTLCPFSQNPLPGSTIAISYTPRDFIIEVYSLRRYIDSYKGGKGDVRSMEGMLQQVAKDCAALLKVKVEVVGDLALAPDQKEKVTCLEYSV